MVIRTLLLNVFNLKKGEEKTVFLLFIYSFFIGISYAFLYTTATSLFLSNFQIGILPYAYMGGGLVSYVLWLFYRRLEKKLNFSRLLFWGAVFLLFSLTSIVFWYLKTEDRLFAFLLFVWINVFLFFTGVGFWGIAAKVFDLRQGKRLFGLIGSGEILSKVLSFFSVPFILKFLITEQLLYIVVLGLFVSICILVFIIKKHQINFNQSFVGRQDNKDPNHQLPKKGLFESLKNEYFAYIIFLAIFPLFATYFVDYIFLKQTKQQFVSQEVVSSFLGIFFGFMAVTEFLLKSFISGRLIDKYGMFFSLIILPALLILSTVVASVYGALYGISSMFFSFVVLSKLFVRVLRTSFLDPAFQILYQPIPSEERLAFQSQVEGVPKSFGNIFAGAVLLLFANIKALTVVHYNLIFVLVLLAWLWVSYKLYLQYKESLKETLTRKDTEETDTPDGGKSNYDSLCQMAETGSHKDFTLIYNIVRKIEPTKSNAFLQHVIVSAPDNTKREILRQLEHRKVIPARRVLQQYLEENPDTTNHESFNDTINLLREFEREDFVKLTEMALSKNPEDRYIAALLLEYSGRVKTYKLLINLLQDGDPKVRETALISAGKLRKAELWTPIICNLFEEAYSSQAMAALKLIGEPILSELERYFDKINTTRDVRLKIISVYASIKGERAVNLLRSKIQYPDETIRNQVFKALSTLEYLAHPSEQRLFKETIDDECAMTVWVMASLLDIENEEKMALLKEALQYELVQKKENIFLLLSMLYDSKTIRYIQKVFQTGSRESKVYATEILDLTVSAEIREIFLPILEDLSLEVSLRIFRDKYPQQKMSVFERLNDIINKDYLKINRWTKACAIILLENYPGNERILLSTLLNSDPYMMQNAAILLKKQNSDRFRHILGKLDKEKVSQIQGLTNDPLAGSPVILLSEKVELVKQNRLFRIFPHLEISRIIENSREIILPAGVDLDGVEKKLDSILFVLDGEVSIYMNDNQLLRKISANEVFWGIDGNQEEVIRIRGEIDTVLMIISPELIYNVMAEQTEYTRQVIEFFIKKAS